MTHGEIMELVQAGFKPEQIMTLATSGTLPSVPDPVPADTTPSAGASESPIKEEAAVPDPTPAAAPSEGETDQPDPLEEIRETVRQLQAENADLKKQIQTANIRDRTIETVAVPDASKTLAEIIRPTFHNNVESNH